MTESKIRPASISSAAISRSAGDSSAGRPSAGLTAISGRRRENRVAANLGELPAGAAAGLARPPAPSIVVLPLGAHEYHGPHLPFETDTILANAFAKAIAARLPADLSAEVEFLPAEPVGYSREHMRVKGSRTLSYVAAIEKWLAIGAAAHQRGADKFIMLNAHGGNSPLMTIIATELRARYNMLAVATSLSRFGLPDGLLTAESQALDIHAGFIETSLMLAVAPDKVDMAKAANFSNAQAEFARQFSYLRAYGRHAFGWLMQDLNARGAAGNAAAACSAAGQKILDHAADEAVRLCRDVQNFDLALFDPAGLPPA